MVDCLRCSIRALVLGLETGEQCQKRQGSMWAKITWIWDIEKADVEYGYLHIPGLLFFPSLLVWGSIYLTMISY